MSNDTIQETDNREKDSLADQAGRARREEDPADAWKKSLKWKVLHLPREQEKQPNQQHQQKQHPKVEAQKDEARRVRRLSKPSEQIGRICS